MRLGLLVRADNRGLGNQTWELHRNLEPARTLIVSMEGVPGQTPYQEHPKRFGRKARTVVFDGARLEPQDTLDWFLETIDVMLSVETPYDFRLLMDAKERGVRTAIVGNYEFMRWIKHPELPRPDLFIAPSTWHIDKWPEPVVHLPHPVARDRLPFTARSHAHSFLHIAGHRAMQDRQGTRSVITAWRKVRRLDTTLVIRSQSRFATSSDHRRSKIRGPLLVLQGDVENYWDCYDHGNVMVAPRRYGGQSLPIMEALSVGMPVLAIDREPERSLLPPEMLVKGNRRRVIPTQAGPVGWWDASPVALSSAIERYRDDPDLVLRMSKEADRIAAAHSWEALGPTWRATLEALL